MAITYSPITLDKKPEWIKWLTSQKEVLDGQPEDPTQNSINKTPEGDVACAKDLVGNLLALLTNESVTIN